MRDHAEISEEWQGDFWPINKINEQLVGHDILQKLKKETEIGEQKQNKR
jgi:hypothetical protein